MGLGMSAHDPGFPVPNLRIGKPGNCPQFPPVPFSSLESSLGFPVPGNAGTDPAGSRAVPAAPTVTALAARTVRGACFHVGAGTLPLGAALTRAWPTDAHMQACSSRWRRRRLVSADAGRVAVTMGALVFDLDAPGHAPDEAWR